MRKSKSSKDTTPNKGKGSKTKVGTTRGGRLSNGYDPIVGKDPRIADSTSFSLAAFDNRSIVTHGNKPTRPCTCTVTGLTYQARDSSGVWRTIAANSTKPFITPLVLNNSERLNSNQQWMISCLPNQGYFGDLPAQVAFEFTFSDFGSGNSDPITITHIVSRN